MRWYQSKSMEVEIEIIKRWKTRGLPWSVSFEEKKKKNPESILNLTFLDLFNICCYTI